MNNILHLRSILKIFSFADEEALFKVRDYD